MLGGTHAEVRNSQAARTGCAEEGFCCVTTRRRAKPPPPTGHRHRQATSLGQDRAAAGRALPPRGFDALRRLPDAPVAASSRANDALTADIQALGSSAGSTGGPGISARTPYGDKSATPAADPWRTRPLRRYAATVPRERQLPGAARGGCLYPPRALSPSRFVLPVTFCRTILLPRSPWTKERRTTRQSNSILAADRGECQLARRKRGRRRTRDALDLKETQEESHPAEGEAPPRLGKEIPGRITAQGAAPRRPSLARN